MPTLLHRFLPSLRAARACRRAGREMTLGDLLQPLGPGMAAVGSAMLSLPFVLPVSLGPLTTPVSLAILYFGWRLWRRDHAAPVPGRVLGARVSERILRMLRRLLAWLSRWRHCEVPGRWPVVVPAGSEDRLGAGGIMAGALLLAVPVPLLPLTNTFPAVAVFCFAHYYLQRQAWAAWAGIAALLMSIAVFATVGLVVWWLGAEVVFAWFRGA